MDKILPRREARENAFLLAFSQTFGDIALEEALDNHAECDEEHPVDVFGQRLLWQRCCTATRKSLALSSTRRLS